MRIALRLTPRRDDELRQVDLNDAEVSALLACDGIGFDDAYYKITKKVFEIDTLGNLSLSISAEQDDSAGR